MTPFLSSDIKAVLVPSTRSTPSSGWIPSTTSTLFLMETSAEETYRRFSISFLILLLSTVSLFLPFSERTRDIIFHVSGSPCISTSFSVNLPTMDVDKIRKTMDRREKDIREIFLLQLIFRPSFFIDDPIQDHRHEHQHSLAYGIIGEERKYHATKGIQPH